MRSYNTEPAIWGGDKDCQHEWVADNVYNDNLRFRAGDNTTVGNNKNPEIFRYLHRGTTKSKVQNKGSVTEGKIEGKVCIKCNAVKCELGQEPSVNSYLDNLMSIFNEVYRVLRNDGTLFVNIADKFGGSGNGSWNAPIEIRGKQYRKTCNTDQEYLAPALPHNQSAKSLLLIPERFVIAMSDNGWIVRNDICWSKPNSMPESCKDRFSRSHEHIFFFTKKKNYYFEQQFEPQSSNTHQRYSKEVENGISNVPEMKPESKELNRPGYEDYRYYTPKTFLPLGRNKRDVFIQSTRPTKIRHFAAYPIELISPLIQAGCPEFICKNCGKPRRKIFKAEGGTGKSWHNHQNDDTMGQMQSKSMGKEFRKIEDGWKECGCSNPDYQPGIVLDPFGGISTTAIAAKRLNRSYITIDLNPEYCRMAEERIANDIPKSNKPKKIKNILPEDNQLYLF